MVVVVGWSGGGGYWDLSLSPRNPAPTPSHHWSSHIRQPTIIGAPTDRPANHHRTTTRWKTTYQPPSLDFFLPTMPHHPRRTTTNSSLPITFQSTSLSQDVEVHTHAMGFHEIVTQESGNVISSQASVGYLGTWSYDPNGSPYDLGHDYRME
ncbi:uncharacterized protein LOC131314078 [Rhododendron vialii]|uniref:uncharacterized protein LOC131314078 n=1 Tax=Rhododendron vialii TaxID=182163 RepID=UPI00265E8128|nr:uncharacterized protein LOC131314078 [Rhododendron vialii]